MSYSPEVSSIFGSPSISSLSSSPDLHHAEASYRRRRSPFSSSESGSDTDSSLGDIPLVNRPRNNPDIPSSPPAELRNRNNIAAFNRRRNLDETLNVRRGDQRGLSQILQDRRRGQPDGNADAGMGGSSASQQPAERPSGRRNTIVEVDDDSDDDIVFTGENRNPNPNPNPPPNLRPILRQAHQSRAYGAIRQRLNQNQNAQDRIFRAPSPGRFRRMMDEIDELLDRRGEAHDAIINDQEDERRRQILSPPVTVPIPPRRIGLGGGGLFRRNAPPQAQIPADELNNDAVPGWLAPLGQVFRFANGRGDPDRAEMEMRFQLGGLAGGMFGGGIRHQQQQEDIQTILSKIAPPPYPKTMITKGFTNDFDMDSIVRNEPIELDDEGNIIKNNTIKQKECLVCSECHLPLLVSSAYKSPSDKLWVLRCGHLLDEYCLNSLQTPQTPLEISSIVRHETNDGTPEKKRRRKNASRKVKKPDPPKPDEYTFRCPVIGCGKEHQSVHFVDDEEGRWKAKDGEGALPAYA
ncbi:hypothetical protein L486_05118 [Kwoniella mangroviensis CBS 10435]|uniref:Uncharacterized protein n=1 Tax=Kwoniella mangroviensis CBS 10435 TaxID=1331196 RepID=A0A1B9IQ09_9TREE|nr:uncharacterized protein I203_00147 [Kwoniella mangroviensis CBS 8507]OCF57656.1 hypothetical protein L486_05118 [Kwoniella mangroviensis CBS 10435]OCF70018.1 hypothetical protein I203_00147 [Kwoniella mangroviensis CBS 8507]OCF75796.1 hypothetical protein I204_03090 [Kwoniella mangroviensis CBS 8886]